MNQLYQQLKDCVLEIELLNDDIPRQEYKIFLEKLDEIECPLEELSSAIYKLCEEFRYA